MLFICYSRYLSNDLCFITLFLDTNNADAEFCYFRTSFRTKEVKFIIPLSQSCIYIMMRLRVYCAQYGDQHALQIVIPLISLNRFVLVMKTQSTLDLSSKTVQIIGAT